MNIQHAFSTCVFGTPEPGRQSSPIGRRAMQGFFDQRPGMADRMTGRDYQPVAKPNWLS
jgi:hypothetical protein